LMMSMTEMTIKFSSWCFNQRAYWLERPDKMEQMPLLLLFLCQIWYQGRSCCTISKSKGIYELGYQSNICSQNTCKSSQDLCYVQTWE
jgi:hypothetical protein